MQTDKKLFFINKDYETWEDAVRDVCSESTKLGYTDASFEEKLIERETLYPTGIIASLPLAMPHAAAGCNRSFIAVTTFSNPVEFGVLGSSDEKMQADLMFVFGVDNPMSEAEVFRKLINVFQDKEVMQKIRNIRTADEGCRLISGEFTDLIKINEL